VALSDKEARLREEFGLTASTNTVLLPNRKGDRFIVTFRDLSEEQAHAVLVTARKVGAALK
jgi:hypothetical protein